ncbi:hypothetical protein MSG28_012117 [Choristoneura fumiferana]|uniref:Uncharacterized protein n=1 Tax=Choristoneura fumiferana TaxID=7141 RepID=A0ACC0KBV6_CHOFU|nr:hypothetical protein MSG28_012117 [Choristoneura fumiferana]
MTSNSSYNNDKVVTGEVEYPATDPASGAFFQTDYKKNEDLKLMLDGSKDSLKLEAMKRIIGMIAKGRDASDLFIDPNQLIRAGALRVLSSIRVPMIVPIVMLAIRDSAADMSPYTLFEPFLKSFFVRNSDPTHLKLLKLEILTNLATESSAAVVLREFQTYDPNQLIRAGALRVLSSIRVPMIVPIVMLAIRDSAADMSPYDPNQLIRAGALRVLSSIRVPMIVPIVMLAIRDSAADMSPYAPLVVGSAAMAFTEVCPDRMSLIHRSYSETSGVPRKRPQRAAPLDPDHRLLLRAAKPLLQSRNAGVVVAVAQLFYHAGPVSITPPVGELMRAVVMPEARWDAEQKKLRGMTENFTLKKDQKVNFLEVISLKSRIIKEEKKLIEILKTNPRTDIDEYENAFYPIYESSFSFPGCYLLNRMSTSSVKSARSERQAGSEAEAAPHEPQALSSSVSAALSMHCASSDVHAAFSSMVAATIKHTTLKP